MGILANSETVSMVVSASSATGFAGGETITLSRTSPGGSLAWKLTRPAGSVAVLSSASAAEPTFVPDSVGNYVITCVVNGVTTETITLVVTSAVSPAEVRSRYLLLESPATIPTPNGSDVILRWSDESQALRIKKSDGTESSVTGVSGPVARYASFSSVRSGGSGVATLYTLSLNPGFDSKVLIELYGTVSGGAKRLRFDHLGWWRLPSAGTPAELTGDFSRDDRLTADDVTWAPDVTATNGGLLIRATADAVLQTTFSGNVYILETAL